MGRVIGGGSFGTVYEADDVKLDRKVAVKALDARRGLDATTVERFHREAKSTARLGHPSAVAIYDHDVTDDGLLFIVMELLSGETLEKYLAREGRIPPVRAVELLAPICDVLAEAHAKGVVHRDVKPRSIVLVPMEDGSLLPKLFDFGIAALRPVEGLTDPGYVSGTPQTVAPEQWQGLRHADARTDLYAVGVIAYRALCGRYPVEARSPVEWIDKHRWSSRWIWRWEIPSKGNGVGRFS